MRFFITVVLALVSTSSTAMTDERAQRVAVGRRAPDISVVALDGKTWKLTELHKRAGSKKRLPVVLAFWCATCHSCRHMETALAKLAKDYKGKAIVVALDANDGETRQDVAAFLKKKKLALTVVLDKDGKAPDVFHNHVTTTTFVIDAAGVVRYRGRFNRRGHPYARDALKAVLAGKAVAVKQTRPVG